MKKYEILYIIVADLDEQATENVIQKYKALVESSGGTVDAVDKWGMRKLAYPIRFKSEGYYVLMNFTAPATLPLEMERQMRISDEVIRFMIIAKE